ncbi:MAG: YfbK domain-containing protein [Opitutaceae bacterium]
MSDSDPRSLHEELEVRVIALLTGELPESEAEELEAILTVNQELSDFRDRMAVLMGDVHEARDEVAPPVATQEMRLTDEQRREIFGDEDSMMGDQAVVELPKKIHWRHYVTQIAAVLIVLFVLGAMAVPSFQKVRSSSRSEYVVSGEAAFEVPPPAAMEPESERYFALQTEIPPELIEGTPQPIRIGKSVSREEFRVNRGREERADSVEVDENLMVMAQPQAALEADFSVEVSELGLDAAMRPPRRRVFTDRLVAEKQKVVADYKESAKNKSVSSRDEEFGFVADGLDDVVPAHVDGESDAYGLVSSPSTLGANRFEDLYADSGTMGPVDAFAAPVSAGQKASSRASAELLAETAPRVSSESLMDRSSGYVAGAVVAQSSSSSGMNTYDYFANDELPAIESKDRMSKLNEAKSEFAASGFVDADEALTHWGSTGEPMVTEVEQSWNRPKVFKKTNRVSADLQSSSDDKLRRIEIPQVNFSGMPLSRVIETLEELSVHYDTEGKGVAIDFQEEFSADPKVNISLRNLNLDQILQFVTQQVNFAYDVGSDGVTIGPTASASAPSVVTEFIPISDNTAIRLGLNGQSEPIDPFTDPSSVADVSSATSDEAKELRNFFQSAGVNFELPGTSLAFDGEQFIVSGTPRQIERMRTVLANYENVKQPVVELSSIEKTAIARNELVSQTPKPEKQTSAAPVSTFSLNVSDVSFKLAQAALNTQRIPDASLIRSEEFVNSFSYSDPVPREDEAVSLNWEIAQHPYEHNRQIVRFSLQTQAAGRAANQPLNLNLLVDNSGSMQRPDRRAILEKSLESLQANLTDQDQLNIVLFARQPKLIANASTVATQKAAIEDALNYQPEGGTNLEEGLTVAYETAQENYNPRASNRVILLTDGAANLGDVNAKALADKVIEQRKQGVALDAYGIGWEDYNDALLEEITRNGDGRYAFLNSVESAADDFAEKLAGTLRVAAADVKVQIIWNPERVKTYRQIGYDLHQLREQDFRDNTVDAAEIGEAESGTALYVLQIDDGSSIAGGLGKLQVRYRVPATGEYVEHAWPLEMPRQIPELEKAPASLRLAAASALFAERLSNNPYAANYDFDDIAKLTSNLPEAFPTQPRVVELQNMIQSANLLFTRVE